MLLIKQVEIPFVDSATIKAWWDCHLPRKQSFIVFYSKNAPLYSSFQQLTVNMFIAKMWQLIGFEPQTSVSDATALPTGPQPLALIPCKLQMHNLQKLNC